MLLGLKSNYYRYSDSTVGKNVAPPLSGQEYGVADTPVL